jgi:hypothetical protein
MARSRKSKRGRSQSSPFCHCTPQTVCESARLVRLVSCDEFSGWDSHAHAFHTHLHLPRLALSAAPSRRPVTSHSSITTAELGATTPWGRPSTSGVSPRLPSDLPSPTLGRSPSKFERIKGLDSTTTSPPQSVPSTPALHGRVTPTSAHGQPRSPQTSAGIQGQQQHLSSNSRVAPPNSPGAPSSGAGQQQQQPQAASSSPAGLSSAPAPTQGLVPSLPSGAQHPASSDSQTTVPMVGDRQLTGENDLDDALSEQGQASRIASRIAQGIKSGPDLRAAADPEHILAALQLEHAAHNPVSLITGSVTNGGGDHTFSSEETQAQQAVSSMAKHDSRLGALSKLHGSVLGATGAAVAVHKEAGGEGLGGIYGRAASLRRDSGMPVGAESVNSRAGVQSAGPARGNSLTLSTTSNPPVTCSIDRMNSSMRLGSEQSDMDAGVSHSVTSAGPGPHRFGSGVSAGLLRAQSAASSHVTRQGSAFRQPSNVSAAIGGVMETSVVTPAAAQALLKAVRAETKGAKTGALHKLSKPRAAHTVGMFEVSRGLCWWGLQRQWCTYSVCWSIAVPPIEVPWLPTSMMCEPGTA